VGLRARNWVAALIAAAADVPASIIASLRAYPLG